MSHLRISPKGNQIAFLDHTTHDDDRGVVSVVDMAGKRKVLSTGWESEEGLAWSPNGSEVWFSATEAGLQRRIYAVDLDGHLRPAFRAPGGVTLQDISSDGRVLLTRDEQRAGIMAMANGATRERDVSWLDWSLPVDISRDGNTLLFDEQGEEGGPTYTVAERDLRGSPPIPLAKAWPATFLRTANGPSRLFLIPSWSSCRPGQARSRNSIAATLSSIAIRFTGCPTESRSFFPETSQATSRVVISKTSMAVSRGPSPLKE